MKAIVITRTALVAAVVACLSLLFAPPAHAQQAATVTLLHGIPGVAVDVVVDGTVVFSNFQANQTQNLSSFAGQTLKGLEVRPTGTTTAVIGPVDYPVPATGNWTVVAHLDADGKPKVSAFENDTSKTDNGKGRLVVVHTAAAPAVDLVVGTERPITNLANGSAKALQLTAGMISGAKLAPTGQAPIVDVPSVDLEAGTDLNVFAVGSIADKTFTFFTQKITVGQNPAATSSTSSTSSTTSTTAAPAGNATVTLLHGIPGVAVDVVVDGKVVFANFKANETKDLSSFSGTTLKGLEVRPTGQTTAVIGPVDFPVPKAGNWTVVAHLDAAGKPKISSFENNTTKTDKGSGRLVVVHAAAAPAVDLVVGTARPIINLANGESKALMLTAGTISGAKLAATGKDPSIDVPSVQLEAGTDLIVYAVGSLTDKTLTFYTQKITVGEGTTTSSSSTTSSTSSSTTLAPVTTIATTTTLTPTTVLPATGSGDTVGLLAVLVTAAGLVLMMLARKGAHQR